MRKYSLISLVIIAMLIIAGCGNEDNGNNDATNDNSVNASADDSENNSADNADSIEYGDEQVLQLGETGTMNTTAGQYEVTPTSFQVTKEWEGEVPSNEEREFLIVDVIVKNVGDSTLDGKDLRKVDAIGGEDLVGSNKELIGKIDELEGEIENGEELKGQLAFSVYPADPYQLVFGLHKGTVSNKITWELPADQAN